MEFGIDTNKEAIKTLPASSERSIFCLNCLHLCPFLFLLIYLTHCVFIDTFINGMNHSDLYMLLKMKKKKSTKFPKNLIPFEFCIVRICVKKFHPSH